MIDTVDIYRAAQMYVLRYGCTAKREAALNALKQADELNAEGLSVWCSIVKAIDDLQSDVPKTTSN